MKLVVPTKIFAFLVALLSATSLVHAHEHLAAGATSNTNGAILVFQNEGNFGANSGFFFNLTAGTTNDPYLGYYYTDEQAFVALAATPDNGGPEPGAAALGTYVQIKLLSVDGPVGASFGFWETTQDGVDSTNLTWSVPVPYRNGTNLIHVSEGDGSPASDPYGHLHGRLYSVTKAGLYKVTWQFVDTSTNGPNGSPINQPSAPFDLYYQADLTLGRIQTSTNGVDVIFATPSNIPDSGIGPASLYALLSSATVGAGAIWVTNSPIIVGDDHLHTVSVSTNLPQQFFRLQSN